MASVYEIGADYILICVRYMRVRATIWLGIYVLRDYAARGDGEQNRLAIAQKFDFSATPPSWR